MSRLALPVGLALMTAGACSPLPDVPVDLFGTWEYTGTSGGIAGESRVPRPSDPRITVEFRRDGTAVFRRDGEVARTLRYRIANEPSIYHGADMPVLYYDEEALGRVIQVLDEGRTLSLSDNVYDGLSLTYRRIAGPEDSGS